MLVALNEKQELINLLVDPVPHSIHLTCPGCRRAVTVKNGPVMRAHFAHKRLEDCHLFTENESQEHLSLKAKLYRSLSLNHSVKVEAILPEVGQIADLLVGDHLALEVQCSRLSVERLRQRTLAYQEQGYQVRWLLGKKLWLTDKLSELHKQFLYFSNNMGFHLWELDDDKSLLRLKYLIYQDLKGRVHYLEKTQPLSETSLTFLRLPFLKQALSTYQRPMDKNLLLYIQKQLYYGQGKWLKKQEEAYKAGDNLLTWSVEDFYPQLRPVTSSSGFCQIGKDLSNFYQNFAAYYAKEQDKSQQMLYPPAFYKQQRQLAQPDVSCER
ncbi:competence protein CoiA [Streptococcus cuniculipharyngis]|uniref:Competence protein CoiA n=1 Tax=Streptococcus cuniculipharyngis TaxID=1562651 RepID=A0A5C5SBN0_9STRE|nr:competence protein CoiA family protein [Streptococcus cuniculipharyngis]TWS96932.1 competence protein CoiA [Streptococcus cuniculipharyngis]